MNTKEKRFKDCLNCKEKFRVGWGKVGDSRKFCSIECYKKSDHFLNWKELGKRNKNIKRYGSDNSNWRGGKSKCLVCKKELSQRNYKHCLKHRVNPCKGENHYLWKGGITPLRKKIERTKEYQEWRKSVFERDNYTCQECGARNGNGKKIILNADHINPFNLYPDMRLDINNGRTLCITCHKKTNTYGIKSARKNKYV